MKLFQRDDYPDDLWEKQKDALMRVFRVAERVSDADPRSPNFDTLVFQLRDQVKRETPTIKEVL